MSYDKEEVEINGTRYKRITKVISGTEVWQKNVPLVPHEVHASGLHIITQNPENDHYDHIECGSKWKEYTNKGN